MKWRQGGKNECHKWGWGSFGNMMGGEGRVCT